jgi:hypothetical protein
MGYSSKTFRFSILRSGEAFAAFSDAVRTEAESRAPGNR